MSSFRNLTVAFCVLSAASGSAGATDSYRCTILAVHSSDESSSKAWVHRMREEKIGAEFSVSRITGVMSGALSNNSWHQPQLIDRGSADYSLKVVTTVRPGEAIGLGSAVSTLVINEYEDSPRKRFTFFDGREVYFGICLR